MTILKNYSIDFQEFEFQHLPGLKKVRTGVYSCPLFFIWTGIFKINSYMESYKMKMGLIILLLNVIFLSGCNTSGENNNTGFNLPTIQVPNLGKPDGLYVENIDGLFDSIRFIPLETDTN
jgi:hypothetical protein